MLKVFLVEDEIVMRDGIKNNIDWQSNGFIFVGEASDGELAFPMIQETQPDIVITDIKMPFMDGLELSRLLKQEMPWIRIIILSGHDEFELAREAVSIGASDYILKPMPAAKLLEAVERVAEAIEDEKRQRESYEEFQAEIREYKRLEKRNYLNDLISCRLSVKELHEKAKKIGIDIVAGAYNFILFKLCNTSEGQFHEYSDDIQSAKEKAFIALGSIEGVITFDRGNEGWALLTKGKDEAEVSALIDSCITRATSAIEGCGPVGYFGGVGTTVNRLSDLQKSFNAASRAFAYRYLLNKCAVIYADDMDNPYAADDVDIRPSKINVDGLNRQCIENFLKIGLKEDVGNFIEEYYNSAGVAVESRLFCQYIAVDMYRCAIALCKSIGLGTDETDALCGSTKALDDSMENVSKTQDYLRALFVRVIAARDEAARKKYDALLAKAKAYIQANYQNEDISLQTVAESVSMSPSHFSTVFSQETGQTFVEYLTAVRIEKAMELLRCSSMKSSEIGFAVGYSDPHYFSYVFKKRLGVTPSSFRLNGKGC